MNTGLTHLDAPKHLELFSLTKHISNLLCPKWVMSFMDVLCVDCLPSSNSNKANHTLV